MPVPVSRPSAHPSLPPLPKLPPLPVRGAPAAPADLGEIGGIGEIGEIGGIGAVGAVGEADATLPTDNAASTGGTVPPTRSVPPVSEPASAPPVGEFVSARAPQPLVRLYLRADGGKLRREGGSRAWRNNNAGNIVRGSFASSQGAIGDDGRFAIFPDRKTGEEAVKVLLQGASYRTLTLTQAIDRYAPPSENDTAGYTRFVTDRTGLAANAVLGDLKASEIRAVVKAISAIEGWTEGTETEIPPESAARDASAEPGTPPRVSGGSAAAEWMAIARREAALPPLERSEWADTAPPGRQDNPRILAYLNSCDIMGHNWATRDEIDWCAAFVNYCLEQAGFTGTDHPGARSFFWNRRNAFASLGQPKFGAIAVFRDAPYDDPAWETGSGHVGFILSWTATHLRLLGGNQANTVQESDYPIQRLSASGQVLRRLEAVMMPRMN